MRQPIPCTTCGGLGTVKRKIRGEWVDVDCPTCHGLGVL